MIQLNRQLLSELGINGLPDSHVNQLLKAIYSELEMRVGTVIARRMSDRQLEEFEEYIDAKDNDGAFEWLTENFPDYKVTVREEFEKLCMELTNSRGAISAMSTVYRPTR